MKSHTAMMLGILVTGWLLLLGTGALASWDRDFLRPNTQREHLQGDLDRDAIHFEELRHERFREEGPEAGREGYREEEREHRDLPEDLREEPFHEDRIGEGAGLREEWPGPDEIFHEDRPRAEEIWEGLYEERRDSEEVHHEIRDTIRPESPRSSESSHPHPESDHPFQEDRLPMERPVETRDSFHELDSPLDSQIDSHEDRD